MFNPKSIGIIFDISLNHYNGSRIIDLIKKDLIDFAVKLGLNSGIYVSHPDWHDVPRNQGESVFYISSYKEPISFNLGNALEQASDLINVQEGDKYIFFITDRYSNKINNQVKKTLDFYECSDCRFIFIGIGDNYDKESFFNYHMDTPSIINILNKEINEIRWFNKSGS